MKPMLASDAKGIKYPVYASPKLDGVRAVIRNAQVLSRSLKPIPNTHVQRCLGRPFLAGLDGELTVGPANHSNVMQATTSGVMSRNGEPDFTYWVFDYWTEPAVPYSERLEELQLAHGAGAFFNYPHIRLLQQTLVHTGEELDAFEAQCLEQGYEGVMVRNPAAPYKYGRSTAREGYLLKVKRFADGEAVVVGAEELLHNANEATTNALGYTERSTHASGKVPAGTLGALRVRDVVTGVEFSIGTGYTAQQRQQLWDARETLVGQIVKYKHFAHGVKDAPRLPVWLGFRDAIDMGGVQ